MPADLSLKTIISLRALDHRYHKQSNIIGKAISFYHIYIFFNLKLNQGISKGIPGDLL